MSNYRVFKTKRRIIKPTSENDAKLIYELLNTQKFIKFVGDREIKSIEDAKKYIQIRILPQLYMLSYSSYSIITTSDGSKIGSCGLYNRNGVDEIDIGFALLPQFEGLGFAYEAAHRLLRAAFEEFKIEEIKAITSKENISSQRLLEKLGLERIGTTKLPNENKELLLYKIER